MARLWIMVLAGLVSMLGGALGETWPSRPIRVIVPFSAGGTADLLARALAEPLTRQLGQPIVVENRGGGGGMIGSAQVAHAEADGYTLVVSGIASHVIAPALSADAEYDPVHQFTHIAYIGGPPIVWVVHPSLGVVNVEQLARLAAASSEPLAYGSPGIGTQGHLVAALLAEQLKLRLTHIPYKGAGPAMLDLLAGHVKLGSTTWTTALAHIKAKKLIAIATTGRARMADFPDVPTFAELGYPDVVATVWFSLSGPPGMPPEIVERLNRGVREAIDTPELRALFQREGIDTEPMDAPTFTRFVTTENVRWGAIARKAVGTAAR